MARTAHILAVAARSAVGLSAEGTAAAVRAGISRVKEHRSLVDLKGDKVMCAPDALLDPQMRCPERIAHLWEHTIGELSGKLGSAGAGAARFPVIVALPEPRPGFGSSDAASLRQALLDRRLPLVESVLVDRVNTGHAGAIAALSSAVSLVSEGQHDLCAVVGADSYLDADTIFWLDAARRLKREGIRSGFAPGEGAAAILLGSDHARRRLGLPSLAVVSGVACAREARDPSGEEGFRGEALGDAVRRVTQAMADGAARIEDVYCDINGERPRTEDWGFALLRSSARFRDGTAYVTPVGSCGDLGAAAAALSCVLAVQAWRRSYSSGPRALVWGSSWTGLRGAIMLEKGQS